MGMASIVYDLHGQLLRSMASALGVHCEGLTQAARLARAKRRIDNQMAKRIVNLDTCYNVLRHITQPYADTMFADVLESMSPSRGPPPLSSSRSRASVASS